MSDGTREGQLILTALRPGLAEVTSSYELARGANIPQREVGYVVSGLRQEGYLIGSVHGKGYYLIETHDELDDTIAHIERRKAGIDRTIAALRSAWQVAA